MNRRALAVLLALAALALAPFAHAETQAEIFARGHRAFYANDFRGAAAAYTELVESGVDDPDVSYDLAVAYAHQNQLGQAIRWYEHALRLRPGDENAAAGLASAQATIGARRAQREGEATVQTRPPLGEALVRPFTEAFLAWTFLALDALFFAALAALLLVRPGAPRVTAAVASSLLALVTVAAGLGLGQRIGLFDDGAPGVVLRDTMLREGPDPHAPERGPAREGERVRLLGHTGGYAHVKLGAAREGWTPDADVGGY